VSEGLGGVATLTRRGARSWECRQSAGGGGLKFFSKEEKELARRRNAGSRLLGFRGFLNEASVGKEGRQAKWSPWHDWS